MAKAKLCDCPHPHRLARGTEVRVQGEGDQPFFASSYVTRGRSMQDYTALTFMLVDPRLAGSVEDDPTEAGWPIRWAHHSEVVVIGTSE